MADAAPNWSEVTAFRRLERKRLQALRTSVGAEIRAATVANVDRIVDELLRVQPTACLAFYWPIRGELALFATMKRAVQSGALVALPVVVDKQGPLQFRAWTPSVRMEQGVWSIPVPADTAAVDPDVLFVPVVGFDAQRYRLGNGGGYYDRTLAARSPRPRTVGIGFDCLRMPTIQPQPHDLPMDAMVTETLFDVGVLAAGLLAGGAATKIECASPPCSMPEPD